MSLYRTLRSALPPPVFWGALLLLAAAAWAAGSRLRGGALAVRADLERVRADLAVTGASLAQLKELNELRARDNENLKKALSALAGSKKTAYDAGLSLQEEKRLLEKQLEIMTTWLEFDEEAGKIRLMRGDYSQKDLPLPAPLKVFASSSAAAGSFRVVSKERFANPTRGKVEQKDGKLDWEPPQAGKDPRSGALGEFVMFTDGPLVLHGPPPSKKLHEAYPHACACLSAPAAKRLYEASFIGTRVSLRRAKKPAPAR